MFIWLALIIVIFLFIQTAIVWSILKRRYADMEHYDVLDNVEEDDDDNDQVFVESRSRQVASNHHPLKSLKGHNGQTTVQMHHHDDPDSDSEIEFDQRQPHSSKI